MTSYKDDINAGRTYQVGQWETKGSLPLGMEGKVGRSMAVDLIMLLRMTGKADISKILVDSK